MFRHFKRPSLEHNITKIYTHITVHEQCVKISCNLEMVTRKILGHLAHFKWNDLMVFMNCVKQ